MTTEKRQQPINPINPEPRPDVGTVVFRHNGIDTLKRTEPPESLHDYIEGVRDTLISLSGPNGVPWRIVIETGEERGY